MRLKHAWQVDAAKFDDKHLVSAGGLLPVLALAEQVGLSNLLEAHVRFVDERIKSGAANPVGKLTCILGGLLAGADSIDDLDVIRSGGMNKAFNAVYACSTLGIFCGSSPTATSGNSTPS